MAIMMASRVAIGLDGGLLIDFTGDRRALALARQGSQVQILSGAPIFSRYFKALNEIHYERRMPIELGKC